MKIGRYLLIVALAGCSSIGTPSVPGPYDDEDADMAVAAVTDASVEPADQAPQMCITDLAPTVACGRCGTAMQACVGGKAETGACMGEHGECTTGDTIYTLPDKCQYKVCGKDCRWPIWTLAPGAQCSHSEQCNAGVDCSHVGVRDCVKCKLSPVCRCPS